jgi:hypothetical protein
VLTNEPALPIDAFLDELEQIRSGAARAILSGRFGRPPLAAVPDTEAARRPEIIFLLQLGVYPEWRESHLLGRQLHAIEEPRLLRRIGQQIADETKHAAVLCDQLEKWGADPKRLYHEPIYEWSSSFDYMDKLTHPAEYFATSNFIGEGLFLPTLLAPMAKSDPETFAVYVDHILPDEPHHVRLGRDMILHYCHSAEIQSRVRHHAKVVAKQYCIGYAAALQYAELAASGGDPEMERDKIYLSEEFGCETDLSNSSIRQYEDLMKELSA